MPVVVGRDGIEALIAVLGERGWRVRGPVRAGGAIVVDEIESVDDLPEGWTDIQEPGRYRLVRRADGKRFGYAVGPHSPRRSLTPPRELLVRAHRSDDGSFVTERTDPDRAPEALIGVKPCELAALGVADRVFGDGAHPDPGYTHRRQALFVVATECTDPAPTCFCPSMGTGPGLGGTDGPAVAPPVAAADLVGIELLSAGGEAELLLRPGTDLGATVLAEVVARAPHRPADAADAAARVDALATAREAITRTLDADAVAGPDGLMARLDDPGWSEVGERCLSCANCTLVCPTCFCSSVEDVTDLQGRHAERWRVWDSCFSLEHSALHGNPVRAGTEHRYRQWLTHKLATWSQQFGSTGCVGCGRCITWCPVGIDLTAEAAALGRTAGGGDREGDREGDHHHAHP